MPYNKTTWLDRMVEFANRFTKSNETDTSVTLTSDPGVVTEAGTPLSAANLNKMEQGIADAHDAIDNMQLTADNITVADTAGNYTSSDVEGALAEVPVIAQTKADAAEAAAKNASVSNSVDAAKVGSVLFPNQSDGIILTHVSGTATPFTKGSSNAITAGADVSGLAKPNNIAIQTWNGVSISPTITGQTVPQGTPSHSFDARNGNTHMQGNLYWNGGADDLNSLKSDVSNGKDSVRDALTGKGLTVADADSDGYPTFAELVAAINTGDFVRTSDAVLDPSYLVTGYSGYDDGVKKNGTLSNFGNGAYAADGLVALGTQLRLGIPARGFYADEAAIYYDEPDWIEANIAKGKNMFGKVGTYSGIKSVQRGTVELAEITSDTVDISSVDTSKSLILVDFRAYSSSPNSTTGYYYNVYSYFNSATQIFVGRGSSSTDNSLTVYWQVIEFDAALVQRGTATIPDNTTGTSVSISPVDPAKSFVMGKVGGASTYGLTSLHPATYLLDTDTLAFTMKMSGVSTPIHWQVVSFG